MMYKWLNPVFKEHVDWVSGQVAPLLWPERRVAFESFYEGIAKSDPDELAASIKALGVAAPSGGSVAERLFRVLLTACLDRLDEPKVTNPDQAALYAQSFDECHVARAGEWLERHPEHRGRVALRLVRQK